MSDDIELLFEVLGGIATGLFVLGWASFFGGF